MNRFDFDPSDNCPVCGEKVELIDYSAIEHCNGYDMPIDVVVIWEKYQCVHCEFNELINY